MKKMKVFLSALITLSLLFSLGSIASAAAKPRYNVADAFTATLSIAATGNARSGSTILTTKDEYTIKLSMELQRDVDGTWKSVKSWSAEGNTYVSLDKSWYVTSGYDYRVMVTADFYNANNVLIGTDTTYSAVVHY